MNPGASAAVLRDKKYPTLQGFAISKLTAVIRSSSVNNSYELQNRSSST